MVLRWADLSNRVPPLTMLLSGVSFATDPAQKNLLNAPVIVAQVLSTPTIQENHNIVFMSTTSELHINGTGFIGSRQVDFYFRPPLGKHQIDDVTPYPLVNDQIILRLHRGIEWRNAPGSLFVIGVDTGGGPLKVNGDDGVVVAEVQAISNRTVEGTELLIKSSGSRRFQSGQWSVSLVLCFVVLSALR